MSSITVSKIRFTKEKVIRLLESDAKYRDNDEILVARYWWDELKILNEFSDNSWNTVKDFLVIYAEGKLTTADVITRARRKAQEEIPHLRGAKWNERHKESEEVKKEIVTDYTNKDYPFSSAYKVIHKSKDRMDKCT